MFNLAVFHPDTQETYRKTFSEKGYLVIDNVLTQQYIEDLYQNVPNLQYDFRGGYGDHYETVPATNPANGKLLRQRIKLNVDQHDFSYYHRIAKIRRDSVFDSKLTTEFAQEINVGTVFKTWVQDITNFDYLYTSYPTFSFYTKNHWITPHYDPTRKVAYLFYLNKEWRNYWGGDLCLMDEQDKVHTTISPIGNRLVLMDVSKPNFNKHYVSPVSYAANSPRYSLVGWYSERRPKTP